LILRTIVMKKIIIYFTELSTLTSLSSCTNAWEEWNTDPDRTEKVTLGSTLSPVIYGMSTYFTVRSYNFTWQIMQVGLPNPSAANGVHRYEVNESAGNGTWNTGYQWLRNLKEMEEAADVYEQPIYKAVSATLQAYIVGILTDSFGDIPFSEALGAEMGVTQPRFDTQEEIYSKLIQQLEEANKIYAEGGTMTGSDLLYNGDSNKWRTFNNSILMRLLL